MSLQKDLHAYSINKWGMEGKYDAVCNVTGVSFDNRQSVIAAMNRRTSLRLKRDSSNSFDPNAILVEAFINNRWYDIGFIPIQINSNIASFLDKGGDYSVYIIDLLGNNSKFKGVRIGLQKKDLS